MEGFTKPCGLASLAPLKCRRIEARRMCKTAIFLQLEGRLPHSSAESRTSAMIETLYVIDSTLFVIDLE